MNRYTFRDCRKRLAILWFALGGLLFVTLVAQSFLGGLGDKPLDAWGWFLANVFPTVSLIASNLIVDADPGKRPAGAEAEVDPFYYRLSLAVSAFYLAMIAAVMFLWPVTKYEEPADLMAFSSVFIGPLQGVAVLVISMFFKKGADPKPDAKAESRV